MLETQPKGDHPQGDRAGDEQWRREPSVCVVSLANYSISQNIEKEEMMCGDFFPSGFYFLFGSVRSVGVKSYL